jgi:hypothetical protein
LLAFRRDERELDDETESSVESEVGAMLAWDLVDIARAFLHGFSR